MKGALRFALQFVLALVATSVIYVLAGLLGAIPWDAYKSEPLAFLLLVGSQIKAVGEALR